MTATAVTINQLESHLWEAANILCGPVDVADFKSYILLLLLYKCISDVHDKEYGSALTESGSDEAYAKFPQNYRFQVTEDCHCMICVPSPQTLGRRFKRPCATSKSNRARKEISDCCNGTVECSIERGDLIYVYRIQHCRTNATRCRYRLYELFRE